jgi:hypothetical protein
MERGPSTRNYLPGNKKMLARFSVVEVIFSAPRSQKLANAVAAERRRRNVAAREAPIFESRRSKPLSLHLLPDKLRRTRKGMSRRGLRLPVVKAKGACDQS